MMSLVDKTNNCLFPKQTWKKKKAGTRFKSLLSGLPIGSIQILHYGEIYILYYVLIYIHSMGFLFQVLYPAPKLVAVVAT